MDVPKSGAVPSTTKFGWQTAAKLAFGACLLCMSIAALVWAGSLDGQINDLKADVAMLEAARDGAAIQIGQRSLPASATQSQQHLYRGSGSWTYSEDKMPAALSDFAVAVDGTGEFVYVIGGLDTKGNAVNSTFMFDTLLEEWTTLAPLSDTRMRHGAAFVQDCGTEGCVVVAGGFGVGGNPDSAHAKTEVLDVATGKWSAGPKLSIGRGDLCVAAVGSKVFAVGGYSEFYDTLDLVEVADFKDSDDAPQWTVGTPLPEPRGDVQCVGLAGKVWVVGGYYDASGAWAKDSFHATLFALDGQDADAEWVQKASASHARGDAALAAVPARNGESDRLVVLGGETHARNAVTQIPDHRAEVYFLDSDTWVEKAPMGSARFRFGAAGGASGEVWALGGHKLCSTGWNDDWESLDCASKAMSSVEVFSDLSHPDVWLLVDSGN